MWQHDEGDGQTNGHPRHALLKHRREVRQEDGDPQRDGDVDVGGEFGIIAGPEGPEDEIEFGSGSRQGDGDHHHADEHHGGAFHDLFAEVRTGSVVALQTDDEHHQGKRTARTIGGCVVVQHLVNDGNHAGRHSDHDEVEGSVGTKGHLHGHERNQDDSDTKFPADFVLRPSNPRPNAGDENGHGGVGCDAPAKTRVPAVSLQKAVVPEGEQQAGDGLGVNAVGVGGPVGVGVGGGFSKPIQLHRSRGVPHQESRTPKHTDG